VTACTPGFAPFVATGASFLTAFHPGSLGLGIGGHKHQRHCCGAKRGRDQGENLSTRNAMHGFAHDRNLLL
jgi:hypothetical protein